MLHSIHLRVQDGVNGGSMVLTLRQKTILNLIVGEYINGAVPVASQVLSQNHGLGVSPATIRNDIMELERESFLGRPYSSAGTIPLDKAYRLHVESMPLVQTYRVPHDVKDRIRRRLVEVEQDVDEWSSVAATILANLVGNMGIATFPRAYQSRVRHLQVVSIQDTQVLLIIVLEQGRVKQQFVRFNEPVPPDAVQVMANKLNHVLCGRSSSEIDAPNVELSPIEECLLDTSIDILEQEDLARLPEYYLLGLSNILRQPEFTSGESVGEIVGAIEDGSLAQAVLNEAPDGAIVRVVIGHENQEDRFRPLSLVLSQYGIPGEASGVVGAVGPMRMQYDRTIAGVQLMVELMSDLIEGVRGKI